MNEQVNLSTIYRSFDDLPPRQEIGFGEIIAVNLTSHTSPFTHGLHRYPAKFIPQIPRWGIREYSKPGDVILDPFMGSGTTLVEALATGRNGFGTDLDPLSCLIAKAKTTVQNRKELQRLCAQLRTAIIREDDELTVPMSGVKNFEHWFSRATWGTLQSIRGNILSLECSDDARTFLLCVFSSILRRVSNADDQSQKTYVSGTLKKNPPPARPTFMRALDRALKALDHICEHNITTIAQVRNASATALPILDRSIDLIVTSPPYLDSVDYMYNMMVEYFWLGDLLGIETRSKFNDARKRALGGKVTKTQYSAPPRVAELIDFDALPDYRKAAATAYFINMDTHFAEASRVLKDGKNYVLVIGNSQTERGQLPVHDALVALAADHGFALEHAFGYRVRRHYMKFPRKGRGGIILMDWVITLKKTSDLPRQHRRLPMPNFIIDPDAVAH